MSRFGGRGSLVVIWDSSIVGLLTATGPYLLINATMFAGVVAGLESVAHGQFLMV